MLFNIHTHTEYSHDGHATVAEMCEEGLKTDLLGFAVTDHCDCERAADTRMFSCLMASYNDAAAAKEQYGNRLTVATGVEIGDALYDSDFTRKVIAARPWDVILGSVHAVRIQGWDVPFSVIDFSGCSDEFIRAYLHQYFDDLREMAETEDYDVLCHLTVPLRYIGGKYGKKVNIGEYDNKIDEILRIAVARDKTLEINTSGCTPDEAHFFPDETILDRYLAMGGRNLTIGSDAHVPERLTNGLEQAADLLRSKGITELTYYLNRQPVHYTI